MKRKAAVLGLLIVLCVPELVAQGERPEPKAPLGSHPVARIPKIDEVPGEPETDVRVRGGAPYVWFEPTATTPNYHWGSSFNAFTMTHESDGTTILTGEVADQAELHGLLDRVRDLGVTLLRVEVQHLQADGR